MHYLGVDCCRCSVTLLHVCMYGCSPPSLTCACDCVGWTSAYNTVQTIFANTIPSIGGPLFFGAPPPPRMTLEVVGVFYYACRCLAKRCTTLLQQTTLLMTLLLHTFDCDWCCCYYCVALGMHPFVFLVWLITCVFWQLEHAVRTSLRLFAVLCSVFCTRHWHKRCRMCRRCWPGCC